MGANSIIDELHRIREAHAKRFGYDITAIVEDLRRKQAGGRNLSTRKPVQPRALEAAEAAAPDATTGRKSMAGNGEP